MRTKKINNETVYNKALNRIEELLREVGNSTKFRFGLNSKSGTFSK